jgi:hypothetical protein
MILISEKRIANPNIIKMEMKKAHYPKSDY